MPDLATQPLFPHSELVRGVSAAQLCDVPEDGPGSAIDDARNRMDDVLETLEPRTSADPVDA